MATMGRKMGAESLITLNRKRFKRKMNDLGRTLKLDEKIQKDLERLNELQKQATTAEEELDILRSKFTVYFQLLPYLMPKLAAVQIDQTKQVATISDEEAKQQLITMLKDNPEAICE